MKRIASTDVAAFFLDHNVSSHLVIPLRRAGHTATTVRGRFNERATDEFILLHAAERGWIVVTHNRKDFELLHLAWIRWSAKWMINPNHAGILIIPQEWTVTRTTRELSAAAMNLELRSSLYRYTPDGNWAPTTPLEYTLKET